MNVKIGKRIKLLRTSRDITQDKLAEAIGVTSQAVSKWENEIGYPDIEYIATIANFFNVTIDELFGHDTSKKESDIVKYCEEYDAMYREWKSADERVKIMRKALAEYPGEERLLVRLATALWYKWIEDDFYVCSIVDGKYCHDVKKCREHDGWEEPVKIMEELLSSSVDDGIRAKCRDILSRIYGALDEKDKVYRIAEYCPDCKDRVIFSAFNGVYDNEVKESSQRLLQKGLYLIRIHLIANAGRFNTEAIELILNLYKFVFDDGNYQFYNAKLEELYVDYADALIKQNRMDEAVTALEMAYEYSKAFDLYLDKLRRDGEVFYTSSFTNTLKDNSTDIYADKVVPQFLEYVLLDESDNYYKALCENPRYIKLIEKAKSEQ